MTITEYPPENKINIMVLEWQNQEITLPAIPVPRISKVNQVKYFEIKKRFCQYSSVRGAS